jgi:lipopolysaccharide/colanic/teichoic acid biosynthesis glycosyltransferase
MRELLAIRPGITDPASLAFSNEGELLAGVADADAEYYRTIHPRKVALSLSYVRAPSLAQDLRLIVLTATRVIRLSRG